jgi:hypothetical protein
VPAINGLTFPVGGNGPDTSRETTVPLMGGDSEFQAVPESALS